MELGIQIAQERGTDITEQNWSLLTFLYFEKEAWPYVFRVLQELDEEFPKREHWVRLAGVYGQEGIEKAQLYTLEAAYTADFLEKQTDFTNLAGLLLQDEVPIRAAKVLEDGLNRKAIERDAKNLQSLGQAWQLAQEVDKAIPIFEEAAGMADDGKIYERVSYLYLESDQYGKCVDSATGALDKGGLRKSQSVYIVKGMCLFNQNKLSPARSAFVSCRRVARDEKDKANQRICGQWITFIDRESKRQAQLAAASG